MPSIDIFASGETREPRPARRAEDFNVLGVPAIEFPAQVAYLALAILCGQQ